MILTIIKSFIISLLLSFVLGYTYAFIKRSISYSQTFLKTLMMLVWVTALVMMIIGNNIASAFTLIGALAIIRFRTPLKDPIDMAFIFFALAMGMGIGTRNYLLVGLGTFIVCFFIIILSYINISFKKRILFVLKLRWSLELYDKISSEKIVNKYFKSYNLINVTVLKEIGEIEETYYLYSFVDRLKETKKLVEEIKNLESIKNAVFISNREELEY